jgi:hypothetical protein
MSVLEDAFRRATTGLDLAKQRDRVEGFYVRRRGAKLASQNPSWDADHLTLQLMAERAVISAYVVAKVDALINGPDNKFPRHLDLTAVAKVVSGSGFAVQAIERVLAQRYRNSRIDWIRQIVWRAVAIHDDDLWKSTKPPRELHTGALDELVDRRLRAVERMACNVNSGGLYIAPTKRSWSVAGPNGPWTDGTLVRVFEYGFLPKEPFKSHLAQMPDWRDAGGGMISYSPSGRPPVRLPSSIASSWQPGHTKGGTIWVTFKSTPSIAPSDVIRKMFEIPRENFLDRSWLFCDMVGAALNIEALWVGKTRRDGNSAAFDTVMKKTINGLGYVSLGPVVQFDGPRDLDTLMADGADDAFFENTEIEFSDLQVGDFVLFWNSRIYALLTHGAWGNEFSHVMGVDADPGSGRIRVTGAGPQVWLAGHGLHTALYNAMASELTDHISGLLGHARARVTAALAADPTLPSVDGGRYVRWAPYEKFDSPGAWWLVITQATWKDGWAYASLGEAVDGVPRAVADDPGGAAGYHHPPDATAIYFPLWEPKVAQRDADGDSWRAYLRRRKADASFRAPAGLAEVKVDHRLAAGLFYRGSQRKIPVVRPRVAK